MSTNGQGVQVMGNRQENPASKEWKICFALDSYVILYPLSSTVIFLLNQHSTDSLFCFIALLFLLLVSIIIDVSIEDAVSVSTMLLINILGKGYCSYIVAVFVIFFKKNLFKILLLHFRA